MYLLDSNTLSNALRGHPRIARKVFVTPRTTLFISTITVHQLFAGSFDTLNKLYSKKRVNSTFMEYSRGLAQLVQDVNTYNISPYMDEDEERFALLDARVKRVGASDCRIAMTAIRLGMIVVTCNGKDFSRIPEVIFEDWSKP